MSCVRDKHSGRCGKFQGLLSVNNFVRVMICWLRAVPVFQFNSILFAIKVLSFEVLIDKVIAK